MAELPLADGGTGCPSLDAAAADSVPRAAALSADERGAASPVVGERRTLYCASCQPYGTRSFQMPRPWVAAYR
jgi:hypothetical protein